MRIEPSGERCKASLALVDGHPYFHRLGVQERLLSLVQGGGIAAIGLQALARALGDQRGRDNGTVMA